HPDGLPLRAARHRDRGARQAGRAARLSPEAVPAEPDVQCPGKGDGEAAILNRRGALTPRSKPAPRSSRQEAPAPFRRPIRSCPSSSPPVREADRSVWTKQEQEFWNIG